MSRPEQEELRKTYLEGQHGSVAKHPDAEQMLSENLKFANVGKTGGQFIRDLEDEGITHILIFVAGVDQEVDDWNYRLFRGLKEVNREAVQNKFDHFCDNLVNAIKFGEMGGIAYGVYPLEGFKSAYLGEEDKYLEVISEFTKIENYMGYFAQINDIRVQGSIQRHSSQVDLSALLVPSSSSHDED